MFSSRLSFVICWKQLKANPPTVYFLSAERLNALGPDCRSCETDSIVDYIVKCGRSKPLFWSTDRSLYINPDPSTGNLEDYLRQAAEAYVAEAEELCRTKGVESQKIIWAGHPVEEILKAAENLKVDLIVMGSHGKSALGAALLGSVTIGLIHSETKFPVLVVRR